MINHPNHAQKTESTTQSCDHSGCWLGFLEKNPEFFEGANKQHGEINQ